jgi:hypothetical protein
MNCINSGSKDSTSGVYNRRVQVALGLVRWKSGLIGGQPGGNRNTTIDAAEILEAFVPYPSAASNPDTNCQQVGGTWSDYVNYVHSGIYFTDPACRNRFGLKTWMDFVLRQYPGNTSSPGLAGSPEQPFTTMLDGVKTCIAIMENMQGDDAIGLASFGSFGYGPQEKPENMAWVTTDHGAIITKLGTLQAAMWTSNTNTAQGVDKAVAVLFGTNQRSAASKTLVLLTDGIPNVSRSGSSTTETTAKADAEQAARDAAALGVQLFTVGIGDATDATWLANLAAIGHGTSFTLSSDPAVAAVQIQNMLQEMSASGHTP